MFIPAFNDLFRIFGKNSNGDDAANVVAEITNFGVEMSSLQDYDRFTITASTTPVDTFDISHMDEVTIDVARTGSTDTLAVLTSVDGVNFDSIAPVGRNAADGAYLSAAALTSNKVTIPFNARLLRFVASGSTDTFVVSWSARNSGRGAV